MLLFEQRIVGRHPASAARTSQSCASVPEQAALHSDAALPSLSRRTQQTVPEAQFAWSLHLSAAVSPPPAGRWQLAPGTHA
jgi:hypothetical protein